MRRLLSATVVALTALLLVFACRPSPKTIPAPRSVTGEWFEDVTEKLGVNFVHDPGPIGKHFMPELFGGGIALFDFDNDGRMDILLLQNGGPNSQSTNRLYHQKPDGAFEDVSAGSGLDYAGRCQAAAIGDVNNDGFPDVLIAEYGGIRLFLNNGNGTFTDVTKAAGLDNPHWATAAAFVDFDRDGHLDLVVVNYLQYDASRTCPGKGGMDDYCNPSAFAGSASKLYRNLGPGGAAPVRFEDVTSKSGLAARPSAGLGVVCADFDGDGWPDFFIANDGRPNHLWMNQKDGTFKEEGTIRSVAYNAMAAAEANMGVALGDVDGDGLFDLFVTHLTDETHRLWKQGPRGFFQDRTMAARLTQSATRGTGFGTLLADFNQDGALDLVLVNGRVSRDTSIAKGTDFWAPYREKNILLVNDGAGQFRNISADNPSLCERPMVARGLACGDLDNDGSLDLVLTAIDGRAHIYRNIAPNRGHWLMIRTIDSALKRDAYCSEVTVFAGSKKWARWLNPSYSYACSNDPRAHFGLGSADAIDAIEVRWPDGTAERFPGGAVDRRVSLRKGEGIK